MSDGSDKKAEQDATWQSWVREKYEVAEHEGGQSRSVMLVPEKRARWLEYGRVHVWEAVVLSFDVDPDLVKEERRWSPHTIKFVTSEPRNSIDDYAIRLERAERNAGDGLKIAEAIPSDDGPAHKCMCRVRLSEFAEWLRSISIEPPLWFPKPTGKKELVRYWWGTWKGRTYGTLGQVVALACDLDPFDSQAQALIGLDMSYLAGTPIDIAERLYPRPSSKDTDLLDRWSRFSHLLDEAYVATKVGDLPIKNEYVRLVDFARWAEGLVPPLALPPQFPRGSPAPAQPETGASKGAASLATKERTNLLVIIGALAHRSGVDLTRTTVAAKEIERVVREDLKSKISVRTVEEHIKKVADALDRKAPDSEE